MGKNVTIAKAVVFFFKILILEATKKQKLHNEENSILFIDSTGINVSTNANKNWDDQKQSVGRSKWG